MTARPYHWNICKCVNFSMKCLRMMNGRKILHSRKTSSVKNPHLQLHRRMAKYLHGDREWECVCVWVRKREKERERKREREFSAPSSSSWSHKKSLCNKSFLLWSELFDSETCCWSNSRGLVFISVTSGQSYKAPTIVIYDSRGVPDLKLPHITTLGCNLRL